MKFYRAILVLIIMWLAVAIPNLHAETIDIMADGIRIPCEHVNGVTTTTVCFEQAFFKADEKMGATYQKILNAIDSRSINEVNYKKVMSKFLDAQKAWLKFRDASCSTEFEMYPEDPEIKNRNTLCMLKMTNYRIEQMWEVFSRELKIF